METIQLLGATMGLGFIAGLRLYSTVLVLGLGLRFGFLHLPAGLDQHTGILTSPLVLAAAAVACLAEFFADKIPWVDSLWDAVHTFVRPIGAALLGLTTFGAGDPALKTAVFIICGGVALTSHSSKAASRLAINHSPEPFSNIITSLAEDLFAPFGVWLSLKHPLLVMSLVLPFMLIFLWFSPRVLRLVRLQVTALWFWIVRATVTPTRVVLDSKLLNREAATAIVTLARNAAPLPQGHSSSIRNATHCEGTPVGVRCAATKRIKGLHHSIGYLAISSQDLVFVARRFFRYRVHHTSTKEVLAAELRPGILVNRLVLHTAEGELIYYLFKDLPIRDHTAVPNQSTATV